MKSKTIVILSGFVVAGVLFGQQSPMPNHIAAAAIGNGVVEQHLKSDIAAQAKQFRNTLRSDVVKADVVAQTKQLQSPDSAKRLQAADVFIDLRATGVLKGLLVSNDASVRRHVAVHGLKYFKVEDVPALYESALAFADSPALAGNDTTRGDIEMLAIRTSGLLGIPHRSCVRVVGALGTVDKNSLTLWWKNAVSRARAVVTRKQELEAVKKYFSESK